MSLQNIRDKYGVPARRGGRIEYTGNGTTIEGTITGSIGENIRVRLDGDKGSLSFHPTWKIRYLDAHRRIDEDSSELPHDSYPRAYKGSKP